MAANETIPYTPCTLQTCLLKDSTIGYQPNVGANVFYLILFVITLVVNLYFGISHRTWSFLILMVFGSILEVVGYAARIQLHFDPFQFNNFVQYLVCLTIAPAFLSAAIYFCFQRIMLLSDRFASRIKPKTFSIIFITSDFFCLVLQAAGGAIASLSGGNTDEARAMGQTGINIMIGGLALQVASLMIFIACAIDFWWRLRTKSTPFNPNERSLNQMVHLKGLMTGLAIATVAIFIRSIFRLAELRDGFQSALARDEITFMILEGAMILIACFCLTFFHPGPCLGKLWSTPKRTEELGSSILLN